MRTIVANILDSFFGLLCRATLHGRLHACFVYNANWPLRRLVWWAVDNSTHWQNSDVSIPSVWPGERAQLATAWRQTTTTGSPSVTYWYNWSNYGAWDAEQ